VIFNTPEGGSHLPDIRIAVPLFYQGHLVGFSANLAHHADVGVWFRKHASHFYRGLPGGIIIPASSYTTKAFSQGNYGSLFEERKNA